MIEKPSLPPLFDYDPNGPNAWKNFNANELGNTINTIEICGNESGGINVTIRILGEMFDDISEIVKSEDSNLANTCLNLADVLKNISHKIWNIGYNLVQELTQYARETLENESGITQSLDSINAELESINSVLEAL